MSKNKSEGTFQAVLNSLNSNQKSAVNSIEGPVMVIAGPGTGKTQLLAARIGNILKKTDTAPENILCLTYTEAGAFNMKKRLREFIGAESYRVKIHTFHSFCTDIIMSNKDEFSEVQNLSQISELEQYALLEDLISQFEPGHVLHSAKGANNYTIKGLSGYFRLIKEENWDPAAMSKSLQNELKEKKDNGDFDYKNNGKNWKVGDLKKHLYEPFRLRTEKSCAALTLYEKYETTKKQRGLFDYADMILWVLQKFQSDDLFLGKYQETCQFILVDEYQDTNGSQNDLVFLLSDFWEKPNLFVVGDDDQSIFRFQGANTENIKDFQIKYEPKIIILDENYRSVENILQAASSLIEKNTDRLIQSVPGLEKNIHASHPDLKKLNIKPQIINFENPTSESSHIFHSIKDSYQKGKKINEIAILYSRHAQAEMLLKALEKANIPYQTKKKENLFQTTLFYQLENILYYIQEEAQSPSHGESRIFEILHYDYFEIASLDIAKLGLHLRDLRQQEGAGKIYWRHAIADPELLKNAGIKQVEKFTAVSTSLEHLIKQVYNLTVQRFFDEMLYTCHIIEYILSHKQNDILLQYIKSFFQFLKDESEKNPQITLLQFLDTIRLLKKYELEIPVYLSVGVKNGVNFLTAHGSKGLEFDDVFIIGSNENNWNSNRKRGSMFLIPDGYSASSQHKTIEEQRRLYYVAMTRAKTKLTLTRFEYNDNEKSVKTLRFLDEIVESGQVQNQFIESEKKDLDFFQLLLKKTEATSDLINTEIIDRVMEKTAMSVTAVDKYLTCPRKFYFENIIRVPSSRNKHMGFGSVTHWVIENVYKRKQADKSVSHDDINFLFKKGMDYYASHFTKDEYDRFIDWGKTEFIEYIDIRLKDFDLAARYELEYSVKNTSIEGIPVTGKLDNVMVYKDHVVVVDYKTGNIDSKYTLSHFKPKDPSKESDKGGKYWRQMVFYKLLLKADNYNSFKMKDGYFDFVEKSKQEQAFVQKPVPVSLDDEQMVKEQLVEVYQNIKNHKFDEGCNDCRWCEFVEKKNLPLIYDENPEPEESI